MWMRWKLPEKWCTFFPQSQFLFVNNFFCLSSNLFLEIQSISITSIEFHQLLSIITNYFYYIYRCQSNQENKSKKEIFENQKTTTVAWNCLCFTLIYYQSSFMLLRTTIYWQIGIKKIEISFQHKNCIAYYCLHSLLWWLTRI